MDGRKKRKTETLSLLGSRPDGPPGRAPPAAVTRFCRPGEGFAGSVALGPEAGWGQASFGPAAGGAPGAEATWEETAGAPRTPGSSRGPLPSLEAPLGLA